MRSKKSICVVVALIMALGFTFVYFRYFFWIQRLDPSAAPIARRVYYAYLKTELLGGYWEDELEQEKPLIRALPKQARVALLAEFAIQLKMNGGSTVMTFTGIAEPDAAAIRDSLKERIEKGERSQEAREWLATFESMRGSTSK